MDTFNGQPIINEYMDNVPSNMQVFPKVRMQRADQQRASPKSARPSSADIRLIEQTDHFKLVMLEYDQNARPGLNLRFNIGRAHSWDEVFATVNEAVEQYHLVGRKNIFVRISRSMGDYQGVAETFTSLLPSGDYGSTLCGGLKIIFSAAACLQQHREDILNCLYDVPRVVADTQTTMGIFSTDEFLRPLASDLYLSILSAISFVIDWLVDTNKRGHILRTLKAAIDPKNSGKEIQAHVETIKRCVRDFKTRIEHIMQDLLQRVDVNVNRIHRTIDHVNNAVSSLGLMDERIRKLTKGQERANQLVQEMKQLYQEMAASSARGQQEVIRLFQAHLENAAWATPMVFPGQQQKIAGFDYIFRCFASSDDIPDRDCDSVFREATYLASSTIQAKSAWVLRHQRFSTWFEPERCSILMVDDGGDEGALFDRQVAAMSYLCANVRNVSITQRASITLSFFCGLHTNLSDEFVGPAGLMKQLTAQLLLYDAVYQLDFSGMTRPILEQVQDSRLEVLCSIFSGLVHQLPVGTVVVCLIDGISMFDTTDWKRDMEYALECLKQTALETRHAVMKLFLTCWENLGPGMSRLLDFPVLRLPGDFDDDTIYLDRQRRMDFQAPARASTNYDENPVDDYEDPYADLDD